MLQVPDGSAAAPGLSFTSDPDNGLYLPAGNSPAMSAGGAVVTSYSSNASFGFTISAAIPLAWGSSGVSSRDLFIRRDAANTLAQRNGTAAQTFRVYNTYTDASNKEALAIDWITNANQVNIMQESIGTGLTRLLAVGGRDASANINGSFITYSPSSRFINFYAYANVSTKATVVTGATSLGFEFTGLNSTATSGAISALRILPTYSQSSGNASNTDLLINRTETAVGSGTQLLIDTQVSGATRFSVANSGAITVGGGATINRITKVLQGSSALDFASTLAGTDSGVQTITVTGAAEGDPVYIGLPHTAANTANLCWTFWVSAANTVSIKFHNNNTVTAVDLASLTYKVFVIQQ